jgi:hypothetical protein
MIFFSSYLKFDLAKIFLLYCKKPQNFQTNQKILRRPHYHKKVLKPCFQQPTNLEKTPPEKSLETLFNARQEHFDKSRSRDVGE